MCGFIKQGATMLLIATCLVFSIPIASPPVLALYLATNLFNLGNIYMLLNWCGTNYPLTVIFRWVTNFWFQHSGYLCIGVLQIVQIWGHLNQEQTRFCQYCWLCYVAFITDYLFLLFISDQIWGVDLDEKWEHKSSWWAIWLWVIF